MRDAMKVLDEYCHFGLQVSEDGLKINGWTIAGVDDEFCFGYPFEWNADDCEKIGAAFMQIASSLKGKK